MRRVSALGVVAAALLITGPAGATRITWEYTGIVRDFTAFEPTAPAGYAALGIEVGTPISGYVRFDDSVPDTEARPDGGIYQDALVGMELVAGDVTLTLAIPARVVTLVDLPGGTGDIGLVRFVVASLAIAPRGAGFAPLVELALADTGQEVIGTTALPTTPPDLEEIDAYLPGVPPPYGTHVLFGLGGGAAGHASVRAEITSLTVPEPATSLLFAFGLSAALVANRRPLSP